MKVLLKYSVLAIVALCLNLGLAEALNVCNEILPLTPESQFVAHTQSTRQALNDLCDHCQNMPCDVVHHLRDVPVAKYILRPVCLFSKFTPAQHFLKKKHTHLSPLYSSDPVSYYVFGLRKIVI